MLLSKEHGYNRFCENLNICPIGEWTVSNKKSIDEFKNKSLENPIVYS